MTDSGKIQLIEALEEKVFHDIPAHKKELTELVGLFTQRAFSRKKNLVLAGEKWDKVFFIHAGIIRLYYTDNEGREFLMNSATKRFQNFCMENPDLAERIPDYHLASYLGITNVSLSRIKKSTEFNLC